jgi:hypothetical protein
MNGYVTAGYLVAGFSIAAYALRIVRRGKVLSRTLPEKERTWR